MIRKYITIVSTGVLLIACNNNDTSRQDNNNQSTYSTPVINYALDTSYPHDPTSFTEGLLVYNNELYESTGSPKEMSETRSLFGPVDLKTGKISTKVELDREKYFGEGIVFLNGKIYQLTYQTKTGFIYDAKTFKRSGEFTFPSDEGWGMTTDGTSLVMSDGTDRITWLDPVTFKTVKTVNVTDDNVGVSKINELEYIQGFIYANVYGTNYIVKIDPNTGRVLGKLDLTSLAEEAKVKYPGSLEMNGIAYDSVSDKIYITGKMWPAIYGIKVGH